MKNRKFNFTLPEDQRAVLELAAEYLGIDISEVIRIGAYRFANLVLNGELDELIKKDINKGSVNDE